ncbi:MAG: DnaJ domain-containing protein [Acidimicrobiia bacterium]|nr:DnaJ domain-containing protein [Acidimicrobiia bacterium]
MSDRARRVLGVSTSAGPTEIREAYRRLVKSAHPDLHPNDPDAARRFHDIQSAFVELRKGREEEAPPIPKQKKSPPRPTVPPQPPQPPPRSSVGLIWWLPVVLVVLILVVVAAITNDDGSNPIPVTPEICVRITDPATGDGVPVNCSTPHELSLFQRGAVTGFSGSYPGEETLEERTTSLCDRSFRAVMGTSPADAGYRILARYPDAGEWTAGDRDFDCLAATISGEPIEGPLAPSFR